jgi:hypothetical protein
MLWLTLSYLIDRVRHRTDGESGALTLEWIVIAAILVAAAGTAAYFFNQAISAETAKLP